MSIRPVRLRRLLFLATLLGCWPALAAPLAPPRVAAGDQILCTVRAIHALQRPGKLDRRLDFLRKQLTSPPFAGFRTMSLLSAQELTIPQASSKAVVLPNGVRLRLTFREKVLQGGQVHLRVLSTSSRPQEKRKLAQTLYKLMDHGTTLVVHPGFKGGALIVGLTCQAR